MTVRAIGNYDFPSADRQELFGDDELVYVHWQDNPLFCSAAAFRAGRAMTFGDFMAGIVDPWLSSDPDYSPAAVKKWRLDGRDFEPDPQSTLADQGVGHKSLLVFTV
jgi:phenol hydroxylase P4 protein